MKYIKNLYFCRWISNVLKLNPFDDNDKGTKFSNKFMRFIKGNRRAVLLTFITISFQFNLIATPKFLTLPLKVNARVVNGWYYSDGVAHNGIDYESTYGQDIVVVADGVAMTSTQYINGGNAYGRFVFIKHDETNENGKNYFTLYAHVSEVADGIISYPADQKWNTNYSDWTTVKRGDMIAKVGDENTSWVHLHFEVQIGGYAQEKIDPYDLYENKEVPETSAYYYPPYGSLYTSCGPNHLWITDPIFVDVQDDCAWFFNYVHCLSGLKIVNGYPDGSFKPGNPVNRVEFIKIVVLALEQTLGHELPGVCIYPVPWNMDPSQWYYTYMTKAYLYKNYSIFPAESIAFWDTNQSLNFSQGVTREEAVHIVRNALSLPSYSLTSFPAFTDVLIFYTYANWIYKIWEVGIIDGYDDNTFQPTKVLNRAEAAKIIRNMLKYKGYINYTCNDIYPEICNED